MNNKKEESLWDKIKNFGVFNYFFSKDNKLENVGKLEEKDFKISNLQYYIKNNKKDTPSIKLIDTSALLRDNFTNIIKHGFIDGIIYIPNFVIKEAHVLSDSKNHSTRQKGKTILKNIISIKNTDNCFFDKIEDIDKNDVKTNNIFKNNKEVDYELIRLGMNLMKKLNYNVKIVTADNNLEQLCLLNKIEVFNINKFLFFMNQKLQKGDYISVLLTEKGDKDKQARGNIDDGTLVVVEDACEFLNKEVKVYINKILVTESTKIIFASISENINNKKNKNDQIQQGSQIKTN